jgi:hypothetical protein
MQNLSPSSQTKKHKLLMVSQFESSSENYCYAEFLKKLAIQNNFEVETFDCKKNYFFLLNKKYFNHRSFFRFFGVKKLRW